MRELSFDFSAQRGLFGLAQPLADVRIDFGLADGRTVTYHRRAAADGRFRFEPGDIYARDGWALDAAVSVLASVRTGEGHELRFEWPAHGRRAASLFLPMLIRGR